MNTKLQTLLARIASLRQLLAAKTSPTLNTLQPEVRRLADKLIENMYAQGYQVMVYQGYRSKEEQDYLYAQGRTRPGAIVTNAKGGQSLHNYGVAFDVVFVVDGKPSWGNSHPWWLLGKTGIALGLEWGGQWRDFPDRPHFQLTKGKTLADFQAGRVNYSLYK